MLLMGKLSISMAIFNSYVTNYQRVKGDSEDGKNIPWRIHGAAIW